MLCGVNGLPTLVCAWSILDWLPTLWAILVFALGFSLVIYVHEMGHFLAAKWAGVRVYQFALGFGRAVVAYRKGFGVRFGSTEPEVKRRVNQWLVEKGIATQEEADDANNASLDEARTRALRALGYSQTEYRINWMPLGGYVKMMGQEDFVVDKSGDLKVKDAADSYTGKSIGKRMVIVSAGVVMNLIFAGIAFGVVFMAGRWEAPSIVGETVPDSPAGRAGLMPGDRIVEINGEPIRTFRDMTFRVTLSDPGETLVLEVEREGRRVEPPPRILPEFKRQESIRQIGISSPATRRVAMASIAELRDPGPRDLQARDEFYKVVRDGKETRFEDLAGFRRVLLEARGGPVTIVVRRPKNPDAISDEDLIDPAAQIESTEVEVELHAFWTVLPETPGDSKTASLLGLVPRLTVTRAEADAALYAAGVRDGDVVVEIGGRRNPTHQQFMDAVIGSEGKPVPIKVRRPAAEKDGLRGLLVRFCATHRETLIESAVTKGTSEARRRAEALLAEYASKNGLSQADVQTLLARLNGLSDAGAWVQWLDAVDVHTLKPIESAGRMRVTGRQSPRVDALLIVTDEPGVVVSSVLGDEKSPTPASRADIPPGAVIVKAAGQPVDQWWRLSEILRTNAGRTIPLTYRVGDTYREATFAVPPCITQALGFQYGERIASIDGKTSVRITDDAGESREIALPDWQAVRGLLTESIGKTVEVKYVTLDGEPRAGRFAVTPDNVDPWVLRVQFYPAIGTYACYPQLVRFAVKNPLSAVVHGFKEAFAMAVVNIQTIRHMLFTRQVGLDKVSGPVGIIKMGKDAAEHGALSTLHFLALLSAGLAVFNFLPIPIVDGGLFLFLLLEKIRGEPLSIKVQIVTQMVGIALIATLFILVTYQDILRLLGWA